MKLMLLNLLPLLLVVLSPKDKLTGRWESKPSVNGNVTGVVFKEDSTFEGYVNRKPFVTARYTFKDSILRFTDNGCNNQEGVYVVKFFAAGDSIRFQAISDSCEERRKGTERLVLGRVK